VKEKEIIMVTPRRDGITCESIESERQRAQWLSNSRVTELPPEIQVKVLEAPYDVVRARSLAVAHAMREFPEALGILWWDSDTIAPSLQTPTRLLASGHAVVGCPVPRKKIVRWGNEREACDFAYRMHGADGGTVTVSADEHNCVEVSALPFGLMWTSMPALRRMIDFYRDDLWFTEGGQEAVALFALKMTTQQRAPDGTRWRQMLSEDYSFQERWRVLGGKVHMLLEPCIHVGSHRFVGHLDGLKHVR
jgi:hypothetical protein